MKLLITNNTSYYLTSVPIIYLLFQNWIISQHTPINSPIVATHTVKKNPIGQFLLLFHQMFHGRTHIMDISKEINL